MLVYTNINDTFIRLIIEGYVIPTPGKFRSNIGPLEASSNVLEFGKMFQGNIENESINIFNSTEDTIFIKQINEYKHIKLIIKPQILEPNQSGEISIQFSATHCKFGKSITRCDLEIMKNKKKYEGYLSILVNVVEDFSLLTAWESANPPILHAAFSKIDLGKIKLNEVNTKKIEIENRGKRELLIHEITTSNSMYTITPTNFKIKSGKKGLFQISIKPTTDRNNIVSKLTIISNDPEQSVINYKISGEVDQPE